MPDDNETAATSVTVSETTNPLTEEYSQELTDTIDPLRQCDNYGISIYLNTLEFVYSKLNET